MKMYKIYQLIQSNNPNNTILAYRLLQGMGYSDWDCFLYLVLGAIKVRGTFISKRHRACLITIFTLKLQEHVDDEFSENLRLVHTYMSGKMLRTTYGRYYTGMLYEHFKYEHPGDILTTDEGLKLLKDSFDRLKKANIL